MGNRFGFVSLLDVKDKGEIEIKLSDIRMGEFKLCFNVARFTLEDGEINSRQAESTQTKSTSGMNGGSTRGKEVNGGGLEAEGIVRGMMAGAGVVQYVGGMCLLISFNNNEEFERFSVMSKEKGEVFQSVEKWAGQTLSFERIAWLRVQGIPLHLVENGVINRIGERFGKVVKGGMHEASDADLSYDYVGVLVLEGKRIQEEVVLQWKGRKYRAWVAEEIGDWVPDFLSMDGGVETVRINHTLE
ncbi:hypothetical protein Hanom_Chr14g01332641 [Helianthus anomalus]